MTAAQDVRWWLGGGGGGRGMLTPDAVDAARQLRQLGATESADGDLRIDAEPHDGLIDSGGADVEFFGEHREGSRQRLVRRDVLPRGERVQQIVVP